ncbi:hypothetical protein ABZ770_38290 [Streptomyces sp. NPDC006654]|uniref:hypothetical protein n=1 Tax=Streptomyces sp. NPDC006654 TaxID=3156897 RepID=UPI00340C6D97
MADKPEAEEDQDMAWARAQARKSPGWSDAQWRRMNAALGIEVSSHDEARHHRRAK